MRSLEQIGQLVKQEGYFVCRWDEVESNIIPIDSDGLRELSDQLSIHKLTILPKIVCRNGDAIVANLNNDISSVYIVFYNEICEPDKKTKSLRKSLFVAMALASVIKVDGVICEQEIDRMRKSIYSLSYITEAEKYFTFIRGLYYLYQTNKRELVLEQFKKAEPKLQRELINFVKDIVISDGVIHKSEWAFLAQMYRDIDVPTKNVTADLKHDAALQGIAILGKNTTTKPDDTDMDFDEIYFDSVLDDLIAEFEV